MYAKGASVSEVAAILRIVPYNLVGATLVLVGGALGGDAEWVLWALAGALLWLTPWLTSVEGFVIAPSHFVERHGLVVIVALGESIVVIGVGAAGLPLDAGLVLVALLSLALSASLWWMYFSDEGAIERAMHTAPRERRPHLALVGFGYWHYGLLLGVVALAAGLKKAIGDPYEPLDTWIAGELAFGAALFIACDVGFRRTLGISGGGVRLVAAAAALATILLGAEVTAAGQVGALAAIVTGALAAEGSLGGRGGLSSRSRG
jgi:low temperature requirement protein LtrA